MSKRTSSLIRRLRKLGPGLLVAAAFLGPGTITTASRAGSSFGMALLWTLGFAVVATIVLQEMSARLGLVSRQGLGEAMRATFRQRTARLAVSLLAVTAIGFGNAAFQTGNIMGAAMGLEAVFGLPTRLGALAVGLAALALLASGSYRWIERVLIGLVAVMSLLLLVTALLVRPEAGELLQGLLVPSLPAGSLTTVIALIGTTVVPYNLFLHASSVQQKWPATVATDQALSESRLDTSLSILLGGVVTLAVMVTAAAAFHPRGEIETAADMARQLEPLLGGPAARVCFALGLFAAGMTSAVTAPLAAAYAVAGCLGWQVDLKAWRLRGVGLAVLLTGTLLAATLGRSPAETILIAQAANGLLLPLVAVLLLIVVNRRPIMGRYRNGVVANVLGGLVVLVAAALGIYRVASSW